MSSFVGFFSDLPDTVPPVPQIACMIANFETWQRRRKRFGGTGGQGEGLFHAVILESPSSAFGHLLPELGGEELVNALHQK